MLADLLNRACTVHHATGTLSTNEYGNDVEERTETDTVCELQQRSRGEEQDRGEISRTTWLLVLPSGTAIRAGDFVVIDAIRYEVDGDPWDARNPRTREQSHIEATLVLAAPAAARGEGEMPETGS